MNHIEGESYIGYLTQSDYQQSMTFNPDSEDSFEHKFLDPVYSADIFQTTPQRNYDLRSGSKQICQNQRKKVTTL